MVRRGKFSRCCRFDDKPRPGHGRAELRRRPPRRRRVCLDFPASCRRSSVVPGTRRPPKRSRILGRLHQARQTLGSRSSGSPSATSRTRARRQPRAESSRPTYDFWPAPPRATTRLRTPSLLPTSGPTRPWGFEPISQTRPSPTPRRRCPTSSRPRQAAGGRSCAAAGRCRRRAGMMGSRTRSTSISSSTVRQRGGRLRDRWCRHVDDHELGRSPVTRAYSSV